MRCTKNVVQFDISLTRTKGYFVRVLAGTLTGVQGDIRRKVVQFDPSLILATDIQTNEEAI